MAVETDETVSKDIPADVEQIESVNENELLAQNEEQYGSHNNNNLHAQNFDIDESIVDHPSNRLQSPSALLITATTLAVLCAVGIIGSLIWRKMVQRKYGMRERLVTEDDFCARK